MTTAKGIFSPFFKVKTRQSAFQNEPHPIRQVDGHDVEGIVEAPYETDITDALVSGKNHIELTLHGWLRNALGPHHMAEAPGRVKFISPGNYMNYADFTESYDCVPFGVERIYIKTLAK